MGGGYEGVRVYGWGCEGVRVYGWGYDEGVRVWYSCYLSFPQASSLSLLAAHGMDFNKWIREGI